jgi:hypothetical protein
MLSGLSNKIKTQKAMVKLRSDIRYLSFKGLT